MDLTGTGFIRLTHHEREFVFYEHVDLISGFKRDRKTYVFYKDTKDYVAVRETPEQLVEMIRTAKGLPPSGPELKYTRDAMMQFGILMKKGVFSFDDTIGIRDAGIELDNFDKKWLNVQ